MFVTTKYSLRPILSTQRQYTQSSIRSSQPMHCHSSWIRPIRWQTSLTNVVWPHSDLAVCHVTVPYSRSVTYTIHTTVVFVLLRLLKDQTSVLSLLSVFSQRLTTSVSLKLLTARETKVKSTLTTTTLST